MVSLIGIPGDRNTDTDLPSAWINPEHIVHLAPFIDGPGDAKRLVVEIKLIGLSIIRAHFGTYNSIEEVDARWRTFLTEIESALSSRSRQSPSSNK